jgi:hypothetical protein
MRPAPVLGHVRKTAPEKHCRPKAADLREGTGAFRKVSRVRGFAPIFAISAHDLRLSNRNTTASAYEN